MKRENGILIVGAVMIVSMIVFCWTVTIDGIKQRKQIRDLQDQITELASKTDAGVNNVSKKVLDLMYTTTQNDARVRFMREDLASMTDAMEEQRTELQTEIEEIRQQMTTEQLTEQATEEPIAEEEPYKVGAISIIKLPYDRGGIMEIDNEEVKHIDDPNPVPTGQHLTPASGVFEFEGHTETYYNLPMDVVVSVAQSRGIAGEYHVRSDGAKMIGDYIMVAACYDVHPYGSLVNTSLGMGIVVDTGAFTAWNAGNIDIAVSWN